MHRDYTQGKQKSSSCNLYHEMTFFSFSLRNKRIIVKGIVMLPLRNLESKEYITNQISARLLHWHSSTRLAESQALYWTRWYPSCMWMTLRLRYYHRPLPSFCGWLSSIQNYRFCHWRRSGLEDIQLEFILKLKIKHSDWLIADTCPQAANHSALFWVWEWTQVL